MRLKVKEAVIVEGKYDKIKLSSLIDGVIIETNGFQIFKDPEQMAMIRQLAETRGILVLTDSDGAGFVIRNYLSSSIPAEQIKRLSSVVYSEGLQREALKRKPAWRRLTHILEALQRGSHLRPGTSGAQTDDYQDRPFEAGLSGGENSAQKRRALLKRLKLPEHLAPNALVKVLNSLMGYEEFYKLVQEL
ncbi:MAG: toprim domain-containing protein [Anaeromassilibacillus sp.]